MPILLLGAIALFGLGYWEYKRGAFGAKSKLPPALPPTATPQQVVALDAPSLANEILDLLYNGQDPRAMHMVASELEKDGFFDAAAILHKRAGELEAAQAAAAAMPPPNQQGGIPPQGFPQVPQPQVQVPGVAEAAVAAATAAAAAQNLAQTLPASLRGLTQTSPSGLRAQPPQPQQPAPGFPDNLFSGEEQ